jgi:ankyrin repeat protein
MFCKGEAPIHACVKNCKIDCLQVLISYGADINLPDNSGSTPIHWSSCMQNTMFLDLLIECGASIDKFDYEGGSALHYAAYYGNKNIIKRLLKKGLNAYQENFKGITPIDLAISSKHITCVRTLQISNLHKVSLLTDGSIE